MPLPHDMDAIDELLQHDNEHDYNPLLSTITLKKQRILLFLHANTEYANAELEQPLASYTMQLKVGDYTFNKIFFIMTQTSFIMIGLAFLRKHSTGTYDFPRIQITMALTDEIQKRNPKQLLSKQNVNTPYPQNNQHVSYTPRYLRAMTAQQLGLYNLCHSLKRAQNS